MMRKFLKLQQGKVLFQAFLLLGYGLYLLYLCYSTKINFFVHPDYAYLALGGGYGLVLLFVIGIINFFVGKKNCSDCNDFTSQRFFSLNNFLVLLPLIVALMTQPRALSSATALNRNLRLDVDSVFGRQISVATQFVIDTQKRSMIDWIRLFNQDPEPDHHKDLKAKVVGFVLRDNTLPVDHFMIARFVISCCAADARPVGLIVQYDPAKFNFKNDEWIEVSGTFASEEVGGQRQPVLVLESYKVVPIPENPYAI